MGIETEIDNQVCRFNTTLFEGGDSIYTTGGTENTEDNDPPEMVEDVDETCPSYKAMCTENLADDIEDIFSGISSNGPEIEENHLKSIYDMSKTLSQDRNFLEIDESLVEISVGEIVDHDDFNTLKNWTDSITAAELKVEYRPAGTLIDMDGFVELKEKFKEIATLCNTNSQCECNSICTCNTVCTCNCDSNY